MIYFIQQGDNGPIKIGYSRDAGGIESRRQAFQISHAVELRVLATRAGTRRDETALHRRFAHSRIRGEWFAPTAELVKLVSAPAETREARWHRWGFVDEAGALTRAGQIYLETLEDLAEQGGCDLEAGVELVQQWAA